MQSLNRIALSSLRAAESIGRLGTLSAAANELGVTPGAISQRLQKAEEVLGRPLFRRTARGMVPTALGAEMMPLLTRGMSELDAAMALADPMRDMCLTISTVPLFAGRWLVWRLQRFQEKHPNVRVRIEPSIDLMNPDHDDVDLCLRFGRGGWSDVKAELLLDQRVFPVASAEVAAKLKSPADLARVPIIRENANMAGWDVWLEAEGVSPDVLGDGPTYGDAGLCLDATMAGLGVFMTWETLAYDALEHGRLVAPFENRYATGEGYWLITGLNRRPKPAAKAFGHWLKEELEASVREWRQEAG